MNLKHLFPNVTEIAVLVKGVNPDYKRSAWLGVTQGFLNFPRILFEGLFSVAVTTLTLTLLVLFMILMEVIVAPLIAIFTSVTLGLLGRVSTMEDMFGQDIEHAPFKALRGVQSRKHFKYKLNEDQKEKSDERPDL